VPSIARFHIATLRTFLKPVGYAKDQRESRSR
jgi:hypothetical protein